MGLARDWGAGVRTGGGAGVRTEGGPGGDRGGIGGGSGGAAPGGRISVAFFFRKSVNTSVGSGAKFSAESKNIVWEDI